MRVNGRDNFATLDPTKILFPQVLSGQTELFTAYDAVGVSTILAPAGPVPANSTTAKFYAYGDGTPTLAALQSLFPLVPRQNYKIITDVPESGNLNADICDCEAGAYSFAQAAQWCYDKIQRKVQGSLGIWRPTTYIEIAERNALAATLADYGLEFGAPGDNGVDNITAWWNGIPELVSINPLTGHPIVGDVGHQYQMVSKFTYDLNVVSVAWWQLPVPPKPKYLFMEDDVIFNSAGSGTQLTYVGSVGTDNKCHGTALDKGSAAAVQTWAAQVAKVTGVSPIINDVANGLYNRYILGTAT